MKGADWRAWAAASPAMKRDGREWHGPCPACGGDDRFRVSRRTGGVFCRICCPDGRNIEALRRIEEAAGFREPAPGGRDWLADPPHSRAEDSMSDAESFGEDQPDPLDRETTSEHAKHLWAARYPALPESPAGRRLAARAAWGGAGDTVLPECVAWIDRAGYERVREAHDIPLFWPRGAAAAILYCFRRSDGCMAVQIDPLGTDGGYLPALRGRKGRWRRTCGPKGDGAMTVETEGAGTIAVCEGPADALAIVWHTGKDAWAAGGTAFAALAPRLTVLERAVEIWGSVPAGGEILR